MAYSATTIAMMAITKDAIESAFASTDNVAARMPRIVSERGTDVLRTEPSAPAPTCE